MVNREDTSLCCTWDSHRLIVLQVLDNFHNVEQPFNEFQRVTHN